ncbi:hypothetical protein DFA_00110 [Cavenderia fasciculata]|uniref:Ankyrin repeat-containing protein n=1 Tax=Cavenderia fasciculata TaxID=261658 RepID=F4PXM2_CACFS|nr:uncharacterized protein DFA_00110 [Cavenderia fasciculata]EGG19532.1 hypothetical protein DFA_00110 [Cavenderia fasciculata]|eukprot:XP_004357826.1 hypothetical protein DFA_00110 [Cavenderia fasciculata]
MNIDRLFKSAVIGNSYTRSVIIKNVKQINRLLSSYDHQRHRQSGYYNWDQLSNDAIQLARYGYFDQLQSTLLQQEQKYAKYKWFSFDDHNNNGDQKQRQQVDKEKLRRRWIPNLKDIIESILNNHSYELNNQYQGVDTMICNKRNQFIQDFMYNRYGVGNLEEFIKIVTNSSFIVGDFNLIKWIESIHNDNILNVMLKYKMDVLKVYQTKNQDLLYYCFNLFQSSKQSISNLTVRDSFNVRLINYIKDKESTTLINNLFDNDRKVHFLTESMKIAIVKKCIKTNHPRVIEIIEYCQSLHFILLQKERLMDDVCLSPGALPIIHHMVNHFPNSIYHFTTFSMQNAISRGDSKLVRYLLDNTSFTIDMDLAAKSGSIEILEMGQHLGKKCTNMSLHCIMSGQLETFKWVIERYPLLLQETINIGKNNIDWFISNRKCTPEMLAFFVSACKNNTDPSLKENTNFDLAMETAIEVERLDMVVMIDRLANQYGYTFKPTFLKYIIRPQQEPTPFKSDIVMYLYHHGGHTKYFGDNIEVYTDAFRYFLFNGYFEPAQMVYSILQGMIGGSSDPNKVRDMLFQHINIDSAMLHISTCKFLLQHYSIKELVALDYKRIGSQLNKVIDEYDDLELVQFLHDTFKDHYEFKLVVNAENDVLFSICSPRVFKYLVEKQLINADTFRGHPSDAYISLYNAGIEAIVWLHENGIVDCDRQSYLSIFRQKKLNKDIIKFIQLNLFIINLYTRHLIIKQVKLINRLLSAPYDRQIYDQEPIGYFNWYQLIEDPIQLARYGYFNRLQSTIIGLEKKISKYKWFSWGQKWMDNQLFKSVLIVNSYTRSLIFKHVKQINRLVSAPYDRQSYDQEPIVYYNWYQLIEDPIQLARHGYFDQLQSELLSFEQKVAEYMLFNDDHRQLAKWIPSLKEIMEALTRYPLIIKSHSDILNKQDDQSITIEKRNQFIQDFTYKIYGLDNLEDFTKELATCSLKAGDFELIKWIESIHNDNILEVMDKHSISHYYIFQCNQDIVYHGFKIFQSSNFSSLCNTIDDYENGLQQFLNSKECTTLITNFFDNHMSTLSQFTQENILRASIKHDHPLVMEIIQYFGENESLQDILTSIETLNSVCLSPGAFPIILCIAEYFPNLEDWFIASSMRNVIKRGDTNAKLVKYLLKHTSLTIDMDLAAKAGSIEILKMGHSDELTVTALECIFSGHLETFKWVISKHPSLLKEVEIDLFLLKAVTITPPCPSEMFEFIVSSYIGAHPSSETSNILSEYNIYLFMMMKLAIKQDRLDLVKTIDQMADRYGETFVPNFLTIFQEKRSLLILDPGIEIFKYLHHQGHTKYFGDSIPEHTKTLGNFLSMGWHEPAQILFGVLQKLGGNSTKIDRDLYLHKNVLSIAIQNGSIPTIKFVLSQYSIDELPSLIVDNHLILNQGSDLELLQFLYDTFKDHCKISFNTQTVPIRSPRVFKYLVEKNLISADMYKDNPKAHQLLQELTISKLFPNFVKNIIQTKRMDNQLFQSVFIANKYVRQSIIKHVKQINRLVSLPYDRQSYDQESIEYYNWNQLSENTIQLARYGYFDQLQSTILKQEQKFAKYKWFDDNEDEDDGDDQKQEKQQQQQQQRKWIPNLKEIIEAAIRYPINVEKFIDVFNKQQQNQQDIINQRNQFIQEFIYKRYSLDNDLEEFIKSLIQYSIDAGDLEMIKWIESIHNDNCDNILFVFDKYNINHRIIFQYGNQDMVYNYFKLFKSPNYSLICKSKHSFDKGLVWYLKSSGAEYTELISNLFDNGHMSDLLPDTQYAILKKSVKKSHPRVMEMIDYFGRNEEESLRQMLIGDQLMNDLCWSSLALPIILKITEYIPDVKKSLYYDLMNRSTLRGDAKLVRYLLDNKASPFQINMDLAANAGSIEILEMGLETGRTCTEDALQCVFHGQLEAYKWLVAKFPLLLKDINISSFISKAIIIGYLPNCTLESLRFILSSYLEVNSDSQVTRFTWTATINFNNILEQAIKQDRLEHVKMIKELADEYDYTFKPTFLQYFKNLVTPTIILDPKIEIFKYLHNQGHSKYFGQDLIEHNELLDKFIKYGWLEPTKLLISVLKELGGCASDTIATGSYLPKDSLSLAIKSHNIETIKYVLEHGHLQLNEHQKRENYVLDYSFINDSELLEFFYETFKDHYHITVCNSTKIFSPRVFKYLVEKNLINGDTYRGSIDACDLLMHAGYDAIAWLHDHGNVTGYDTEFEHHGIGRFINLNFKYLTN